MNNQNRSRKQRIVKHPIVNIDDVCIEAGSQYVNWILVCRQKLRERELTLLRARVEKCDEYVLSSINKFTIEKTKAFDEHKDKVNIVVRRMGTDNHQVYNEIRGDILNSNSIIMKKCDALITEILSKWPGYKPRSKHAIISTFREYFKAAKTWWDIRKMKMMAEHFWIPICDIISKFVKQAAAEFFCNRLFKHQKNYETNLYTLILKSLFEGKILLPQTKPLYLIPAQTYLRVTIQYKNKTEIQIKQCASVDQTYSMKYRAETIKLLNKQYRMTKTKFEKELLALHYEVDNYTTENVNNFNTIDRNTINPCFCNQCTQAIAPMMSSIPIPTYDDRMNYTSNHQ